MPIILHEVESDPKTALLADHFLDLFERDLDKLRDSIASYSDEEKLWTIDGNIHNSAGNLCLHICGNLQHFIGLVLGGVEYRRDRDKEFSAPGVPKADLLNEIAMTRTVVRSALEGIGPNLMASIYPVRVLERKWHTSAFLIHLFGHLNYHLGQVDYHKRTVGA